MRAYLRSFSLGAIVLCTDKTVVLTRDIARVREPIVAAWWGEAGQVLILARRLQQSRSHDVLAAARELRVVVQAHHVVVARAQSLVAKMDQKIAVAKDAGSLRWSGKKYMVTCILLSGLIAGRSQAPDVGGRHRKLRLRVCPTAGPHSFPEQCYAVTVLVAGRRVGLG